MLPFILAFYYAQITSKNIDPTIITDYIIAESVASGVDPQMVLGIAKAESGLNPQAIGDHGTSHGLFQIHLPAHKDITKEQAEDPIFATQWSINEMKKNGCKIWSTCQETMKGMKYSYNALQSLTREVRVNPSKVE